MSSKEDASFYKAGLRFECTGCGNCCKTHEDYAFVYLTDKNVFEISARLNLSETEFKAAHCTQDHGGRALLTMPNGRCNFLEDNRCTVYSVRPDQCRAWPFWRENLTEEAWTEEVAVTCPGINRGRLFTEDEIDTIADERDKAYGIDF